MSPEEFLNSKTGYNPGDDNIRSKRAAPQAQVSVGSCSDLTYKNWVEEGKVSPVQNQLCGCCYIFAAVAAVESVFAIKYETSPPKYSEQQLLPCAKSANGIRGGCNGWISTAVWNVVRNQGGVVPSADYAPHNGIDSGACQSGLDKAPNTIVEKYFTIPEGDEETLKCSLAANGPHTIGMNFSGNIQAYKSGIFDDYNKECILDKIAPNHEITLVGFGTEPNRDNVPTDYWLIRNSWSSRWGQGGYIKVARHSNICHIATIAKYPKLAEPPGK